MSHPRLHPVRSRFFQTALVLIALALATTASAQVAGGVIQGTVADQQGGALPGATITLRNVETGVARSVVSENDGRYRFAALPPGRYDVTAELSGFAMVVVQGLTITIGLELRNDIRMGLQGIAETLTVSGVAPVIEPTKSEVAAVITQEQIANLPIEGRIAVS